mgnify:CR=1 FL=1
MIIVDINQTMIANLMVQIGNHTNMELHEDLIRHMVLNALRSYKQMYPLEREMIIACDDKKYWRRQVFPAYKANRLEEEGGDEEEEPETLTPQIPVLLDLLDALGIPMLGVDDYEADDVMATFAVREKGPIRVVTGDRDLFQLVDDKRDVKVVYLARGISQHDLVDIKWVANKYGIPGDRYALFAMFRGDPSDGLPGVKGIGEKGAALIANHFATVEEALSAAHENDSRLTPSLAKKIREGAEYLAIAPTLVHCAKDVGIPAMDIKIPSKPADLSQVYKMKDEYGLGASVDRLISALGW